MRVQGVIYFYMFICVALLLFNVIYILRDSFVARRRELRIRKWREALFDGDHIRADLGITSDQKKSLARIENLMAFHAVMSEEIFEDDEKASAFFYSNLDLLRDLVRIYRRRPAMERAYIAHVIASYHTPLKAEHDNILEFLLGYLDDSTVYCRENVLQALYSLGSGHALEQALAVISERGFYHNPKLISDGMAGFTGDKTDLVKKLWRHKDEWEECLIVAAVQFAAGLKEDTLSEEFMDALAGTGLSEDVRFAIIRYFRRHHYEPAAPVLRSLLRHDDTKEDNLAVAAASTLQVYLGRETKDALIKAMNSRSWYVRRNAAQSLVAMGLTDDDMAAIHSSRDRYAEEMLQYVIEETTEGR